MKKLNLFKKYYYIVHYGRSNLFSMNGYVDLFYDKDCKKIKDSHIPLDLFYNYISTQFKCIFVDSIGDVDD